MTESDAAAVVDPLDQLFDQYGVAGRRLTAASELLLRPEPVTLASLILQSGLARRSVEQLLQAVDFDPRDVKAGPIRLGGGPGRERLEAALNEATGGSTDRPSVELTVSDLAAIVRDAPKAKRDLDHVSATPETLERRARHLSESFLLVGRHIVFMGDHDLTSIAVAGREPRAQVTVVDIDDDLLGYIATVSARLGLGVRCLYADFSVSLPEVVVEAADLVFTDPPYTPEGVAVFLARSAQACTRKRQARILMAYGFSDTHPALGLKVQQEIVGLELSIESITPAFNQYLGAEAIGARSDLYCIIPTANAAKRALRVLAKSGQSMYTHGARSIESAGGGSGGSHRALADIAGFETEDLGELAAVGCLVRSADATFVGRSPIELLAGQVGRPGETVLADLATGHESWLARALIASNADALYLLLPNNHPDTTSKDRQDALAALVFGKYQLRFLRSQPTNSLAVVHAQREAVDLVGAARARAVFLGRANATLRSALVDALYKAARSVGGQAASKEVARQQADLLVANAGASYGQASVFSLPRDVLARVLSLLDSVVEPA